MHLNAFKLDPSGVEGGRYKDLVDLILTELWLHRSIRKIFVSYRRADSLEVAHQLWESLTRMQYEVFLDDCTLNPGVNFQRELMWWLNDADLILLLASPNLAVSEWVQEEINAATHASIGFLAVVWPEEDGKKGSNRLPQLMPDQIVDLLPQSFASTMVEPGQQRLVESAVHTITEKVAEKRVQAIQQRLWSLLPYLKDSIPSESDVHDGILQGDLKLFHRDSEKLIYARVLPFRPTLDAIYSLRQDFNDPKNFPKLPTKALFFYRENDRHDQRVWAMEWMLEPERPEEALALYRVLPYTGDTLDLGWLK